MTKNTLSPDWRGELAAAIDPARVRFKAVAAPTSIECQGCHFLGQRSSVCFHAARLAVDSGEPDCDHALPDGRPVIYILDKSDPRQLKIELTQKQQ